MNQKGFANIILIVVIVVLAVAAGYFVFVKKSEPVAQQPTPTSTQTKSPIFPIPAPKDEIANWKTYNNETIGFSFKYPSTLTIKEVFEKTHRSTGKSYLSTDLISDKLFSVIVVNDPSIVLDRASVEEEIGGFVEGYDTVSSEKISIGGINATLTTHVYEDGSQYALTIFENNQDVYVWDFSYKKNDLDQKGLVSQILSTVKFTH